LSSLLPSPETNGDILCLGCKIVSLSQNFHSRLALVKGIGRQHLCQYLEHCANKLRRTSDTTLCSFKRHLKTHLFQQ